MEGNLQDPTDKNDFMMNHTGASLGWLEEGDCSEGSFEFDVSTFQSTCALSREGTTTHGWWPLPFTQIRVPPTPDFLLVEPGYFDPIIMDICPPRTFECTAGFVSSPFLFYIHSASRPP